MVECNIIHTDVKPENVLFVPPLEEYTRLCIQASAAVEAMARMRLEEEQKQQEQEDSDGLIRNATDTKRIPSFVFRACCSMVPDR